MPWKTKILLVMSVVSLMGLPVAKAVACDCDHVASSERKHGSDRKKAKMQCDQHKKKNDHMGCSHKKKCDHKKSCEMKKKDCCDRKVPPTNKKHHDKSSLLDRMIPFHSVAATLPNELWGPPGTVPRKLSCHHHKNAYLAINQSFLC